MYKNRTIGVVVPAYNEEMFIAEVINTMPSFVDRIYVTNDASTDNTGKILAGINDKRLTVINHEKTQGPGSAMLSGYKRARDENIDITAIMAGDGQMDPMILDQIIEPIIQGKTDYTKGDRLSIRENCRGMPGMRLFGNRILTYIIRIASGYRHICDPLNGYTAINLDTLKKLDLDRIEPGYAFETDLLIKLGAINAVTVNVNMPARYRNEKSKLGFLRFVLRTSWVIARDYLWRARYKNTATRHIKIKARDVE